ncbi:hypothetical protein [Paraburkholderia jirisanensis]
MKNVTLALIEVTVILLGACSSLPIDQLPPRTPRDFLLDIKSVADADDLADVDRVARQLRINLVPEPEKAVYDADGTTLLGYVIDVKEKGATKEYRSQNFQYSIFTPVNRHFKRLRISISVNPDTLCVTSTDLVNQFGESTRYRDPHTSSVGYTYKNAKNAKSESYFRFEEYGCLYKFGFFITTEQG